MTGSFDDPPIIIRQRRFTLCVSLIAYLLVTLALAFAAAYPMERVFPYGYESGRTILYVVLYVGLFAFSCLSVFAALALALPARLKIEPAGLIHSTVWNARRFTWDDIDRFDVHGDEHGIIFFNLSQRYLWEHPNIDSPIGWLGMRWERDAIDLANLLNRAKRKWSEDRTPRIVNPIPEMLVPPPIHKVS